MSKMHCEITQSPSYLFVFFSFFFFWFFGHMMHALELLLNHSIKSNQPSELLSRVTAPDVMSKIRALSMRRSRSIRVVARNSEAASESIRSPEIGRAAASDVQSARHRHEAQPSSPQVLVLCLILETLYNIINCKCNMFRSINLFFSCNRDRRSTR